MQAVKAQLSLCICTDSPELLLLADAIGTEISCTGPFMLVCMVTIMTNNFEQTEILF